MREIKFRVWNKELGKMWSWHTIETSKVFALDSKLKGNFMVIPNSPEHILLQYTGLKDKNGKEIYEGDIFPCVYAFDGCKDHLMVVEYNSDRAGFFPRWDYKKCHQKGVSKTMHDLTHLEVIGNIYENKELI